MSPEKLAAMMELGELNHRSFAIFRKADEILDKLIELVKLQENLIEELKRINKVVVASEA